ncbi:MAG: leucyl aminopeptidase [Chloroflexota bacterium]
MTSPTVVHTSISHTPDSLPTGVLLVVPFFKDEDFSDAADVRLLGGKVLERALAAGDVRGTLYEVTIFYREGDGPGLVFVGSGDRESADPLRTMRVFAAASRYLTGRGYMQLAAYNRGILPPTRWAHAAIEGLLRGAYDPGLKKTKGQNLRHLAGLTLVSGIGSREELDTGMQVGRIVGEAANLARDLVNTPANELTPRTFALRAEELARQCELQCDVMDEVRIAELQMGLLLAVASGSAEPPRVIRIRYGDHNAPIKLALVGKGITFDSGGLSLKPPDSMETMKGDMGGGAAVVAAMIAVAQLAPSNISVTGYIGATENMPGGRAMRPGDVFTAMNGETVEVLNTDAEGRLVLADLLVYATREGATHIVDFATLTGGAVVALGHAATLATGTPDSWVAQVVHAASSGLERAWHMPLYEDYRRAMDSDVADIKNTGGRWGSALTASAFLSDFVDGPQWAHMDIAGTSWADSADAFRPAGGTGESVATIASLVLELSGD